MRKYFSDKRTGEIVKTTDITGKVYHNFVAVEFNHMIRSKHGSKSYWKYDCICGKQVVRFTQLVNRGRIKSCGCQKLEHLHTRKIKYDITDSDFKRTYQSWASMKYRCNSPKSDNYKNYGKVGISVCESWNTFDNFFIDMGIRPPNTTIDRIDVNKNYEPSNCRWASSDVQANNRRNTYYVTYNNETLSLRHCVKKYSKNRYDTVWNRLKSGWKLELALKMKPDKGNGFLKKCINVMDEDEFHIYMDK